MGLKTSIRRQIAKFLGTHSLQNDVAQLVEINKKLYNDITEINKKLLSQLQNLQALNVLSAPCIPSSIKDSFYLQSFPSYGGLRACYSDKAGQNIREFLRLTRPIASKGIKLRRFGGAHDGGYVMAIPPHLSDTLSGVSLRTLDNITMADFTLKLGLQNSSNDSYLNDVFTPPPPRY